MKILLTFLGTGNYQPCRYQVDGVSSKTEETFCSVALYDALKPDRIISLQTKEATERYGDTLTAALKKRAVDHKEISIPKGESEKELWEIFSKLTGHIPEGCTLHLDITHGFRSLPLLSFIALNYLRVTRKVAIGGIYYGAWEARSTNNVAPVFNLTGFLSLLNWTAAADQFLATGSAARLGKLLTETQDTLRKDTSSQPASSLPKKLKSLGACLKEASDNLILLRTGELEKTTQKLSRFLEEAKPEMELYAQPFLDVLKPVQDELLCFRNTDLETLRKLIKWLADHEQIAAALTLASEWLTSYVMIVCDQTNHHANYEIRKPFNLTVSLLGQPNIEIKQDDLGQRALDILKTIQKELSKEKLDLLKSLASRIRQARNDLNHAGFNDSPLSAANICNKTKEIANNLTDIKLPKCIPPSSPF